MFGVLQDVVLILCYFAVGILSLSFSSCSLSHPFSLSISLSFSLFFPLSLYPSLPLPLFLQAQSLPFAFSYLPSSLSASSLTRSSLVRWDYANETASALMHTHTHKYCGHLNPCCSGQHVVVSRTSRWHIFGRWKSEAACCCVAVYTLKASLGKRNSFLPHYSIFCLLLFFFHQSSPSCTALLFSSLFFVDHCISLSLAHFSLPHKQDLFLIDAPCSIGQTPPITFYVPVFCFF